MLREKAFNGSRGNRCNRAVQKMQFPQQPCEGEKWRFYTRGNKVRERDELIFPKPSNHPGKDGPVAGIFDSWFHTQTMKYSGCLKNCNSVANEPICSAVPSSFTIDTNFSDPWGRKSVFLHVSRILSCSIRLLIPRAPLISSILLSPGNPSQDKQK